MVHRIPQTNPVVVVIFAIAAASGIVNNTTRSGVTKVRHKVCRKGSRLVETVPADRVSGISVNGAGPGVGAAVLTGAGGDGKGTVARPPNRVTRPPDAGVVDVIITPTQSGLAVRVIGNGNGKVGRLAGAGRWGINRRRIRGGFIDITGYPTGTTIVAGIIISVDVDAVGTTTGGAGGRVGGTGRPKIAPVGVDVVIAHAGTAGVVSRPGPSRVAACPAGGGDVKIVKGRRCRIGRIDTLVAAANLSGRRAVLPSIPGIVTVTATAGTALV